MKTSIIDDVALAEIKDNFDGEIITTRDPAYEMGRKVWNGLIDKFPAVIARCMTIADIKKILAFCREHDHEMAVRGGGHNIAGYGTSDGGIVLDLSLMNKVEVSPEERTVTVQSGARWKDVDPKTQHYGLATPGGEVSDTGVAGLTLGGGVGYLRRLYGLSCDNLLSVNIITADGELRRADEKTNQDLFWALRGGGGNFGIVTDLTFQLHPVGPVVTTLNPMFSADQTRKTLETWYDFTRSAPDEASTAFGVWSVPSHPDIPNQLHGVPISFFDGVFCGKEEVGTELFLPLRKCGKTLLDLSGQAPYLQVQTAFDEFMQTGDLYYWKSLFLNELDEDFMETFLSWTGRIPSPRILVIIRHLGGAIARIGENETAYHNRKAQYMVSIDGAWTDPIETERNIEWIRNFWEALNIHSDGGVYLNFPGLEEKDRDIWKKSHGSNFNRLKAVKQKYDPTNFFRVNQNINPQD